MHAQLRALNTAPAATNTAIGRDGLLVYDGGVITIENGGLDVTGTATISGTLTGSGDFNWSGPVNISGDITTTGSLDVDGPMTTTGALSVEGATSLKNDLTVEAGKKITLGGLTLENTGLGGGTLNFPSGSISQNTSFGMLLVDTAQIELASPAVKLSAIPNISSVTANLYIDGAGVLRKIV